MLVRYTDAEIQSLVNEPKWMTNNPFSSIRWLDRGGHQRADVDVEGDNGHQFTVKLRRNRINALDFSVILGMTIPNTNVFFRLRRYNGKHWHWNKIERDRFRDFHIHTATQRYQERGFKEDGYAQPTSRYSSFGTALQCLISDGSFYGGNASQPSLFDRLS